LYYARKKYREYVAFVLKLGKDAKSSSAVGKAEIDHIRTVDYYADTVAYDKKPLCCLLILVVCTKAEGQKQQYEIYTIQVEQCCQVKPQATQKNLKEVSCGYVGKNIGVGIVKEQPLKGIK